MIIIKYNFNYISIYELNDFGCNIFECNTNCITVCIVVYIHGNYLSNKILGLL